MAGTFSTPTQVSDLDMQHGTCATHVPWCMPVSLTSDFLWRRWRGKRSWHSRRMPNPQFYVSGKRPMAWTAVAIAAFIKTPIAYRIIIDTLRCRYNTVNFLQNLLRRHHTARPLGRDMRCLLLAKTLFIYSASVTEVMYAISCHVGPWYNGTRLYVKVNYNTRSPLKPILEGGQILAFITSCTKSFHLNRSHHGDAQTCNEYSVCQRFLKYVWRRKSIDQWSENWPLMVVLHSETCL